MKNVKAILVPTLVLTIISVLIAGLLAFTYNATGVGNIVPGLSDEECETMAPLVIPDAKKLVRVDYQTDEKDLLGVYQDEEGTGVVLHIQTVGYAGKSSPIEALVGFDSEGTILGVTIVSCPETPGLGTRIEDPEYLQNYVGVSGSADSVDTITSATISSTALRDGINYAIEQFEQVKGEVF
jgi:electron transport complex protein RnfG